MNKQRYGPPFESRSPALPHNRKRKPCEKKSSAQIYYFSHCYGISSYITRFLWSDQKLKWTLIYRLTTFSRPEFEAEIGDMRCESESRRPSRYHVPAEPCRFSRCARPAPLHGVCRSKLCGCVQVWQPSSPVSDLRLRMFSTRTVPLFVCLEFDYIQKTQGKRGTRCMEGALLSLPFQARRCVL